MIIAIAGGTGSGKTTVANKIKELYTKESNINVSIVSMDNYYKNSNVQVFDNYDHPNAFNMNLLYDDLFTYLSKGQMIQRSYDFVSKECSTLRVENYVDIVILEGLYPFYLEKIQNICTLKIFLDIDEKLRIERRVSRDLEERGISLEENMKMIHSFVNEMYNEYVIKQRKMANRVFINNEECEKYFSHSPLH